MRKRPYYHVDVFATNPLGGNGLTVFTEAGGWSPGAMQLLTQEMRQFESIFLEHVDKNTFRARIFTVEEELDFAGHPLLGAAAVLHGLSESRPQASQWTFILNKKSVEVTVQSQDNSFLAEMNQGPAEFGYVLNQQESISLLTALGLSADDLFPGLYPTVVSTGLPYLIIPLQKNVYKANMNVLALEEQFRAYGAKFLGVLEIPTLTIRTGDTAGLVEDIATGSLAGPAGAFVVKHGLQPVNSLITINQGENLGRPSRLSVKVNVIDDVLADVLVSGEVFSMSNGWLDSSLEYFLADI